LHHSRFTGLNRKLSVGKRMRELAAGLAAGSAH